MSLDSKLRAAQSTLDLHYKSLGTKSPVEGDFITSLKNMGATSEANLEQICAEDLEGLGVPCLVARKIVSIFGGGENSSNKQIVIVDDNPVNLAARLKPEELVGEYDPNDPTSPFGERLKTISEAKTFLVYDEESGDLLVGPSAKLLRELLDNYPSRNNVLIDGVVHETFRVGGRPARFADQNPVKHDEMLRPDGTSGANTEWGSIPREVRQLIFLACKTSKEAHVEEENYIFDMVQGKSVEETGKRWPKAFVLYQKKSKSGDLPSLKMELSKKSE